MQAILLELARIGFPARCFDNRWLVSAATACGNQVDKILGQLLAADICEFAPGPTFPCDLSSCALISGPAIFQVIEAVDVSKRKDSKHQSSNRTLKILLSDGIRCAPALEWRSIVKLTDVQPGAKILCRDVPVHLSHLLLSAQNTLVLGGGRNEEVS